MSSPIVKTHRAKTQVHSPVRSESAAIAGLLACAAALLAVPCTRAQDATEERQAGTAVDAAVRPAPLRPRSLRPPAQLRSPETAPVLVELPATIAPAARDEAEGAASCDPIGYLQPAPEALLETALWEPAPDGGWVRRLELHSPGATGLRVVMTDSRIVELRFYDPAGPAVFGPYVRPRLNSDGRWWSTVIFGDTMGIELYCPAHAFPPVAAPELTDVFYMYADIGGMASGESRGACFIDVMCDGAWAQSIESNAIGFLCMGVVQDGQCFGGQCTGALLNRSPSDNAPILMTARHCISTQDGANSLIVIWFFQNDVCNGTPPALNLLPRNDGALLLKTTQTSDWTLLGLYEPDESGNYCGWQDVEPSFLEPHVAISHPGARTKRISYGVSVSSAECTATDLVYGEQVAWNEGATRGGSSGCPVFNYDRRVWGTLSCGQAGANCSDYGDFGLLTSAYHIIRWFLFNMANPTYVDGAVSGDSGNRGESERGSLSNPFNTVYEATFCVPSGGIVSIRPGVYSEQFWLWRPMTLSRAGSSGVVRIAP